MPTPNEPKNLTGEDLIRLEALVDTYGLDGVVNGLATVAWMKADHVRAIWYDEALSRAWSEAARFLREACKRKAINNTYL